MCANAPALRKSISKNAKETCNEMLNRTIMLTSVNSIRFNWNIALHSCCASMHSVFCYFEKSHTNKQDNGKFSLVPYLVLQPIRYEDFGISLDVVCNMLLIGLNAIDIFMSFILSFSLCELKCAVKITKYP